jgi:hypothetical protein
VKLSDFLLGDKTPHPSSRVARALAEGGVSRSLEFDRVFNLPRRKLDLESTPDATPVYYRAPNGWHPPCRYCRTGPASLRPIQSAMLIEAAAAQGGFFAVGVGKGKTLASLLFWDALQSRRTVLFIPPSLVSQLMHRDEIELRQHFDLPRIQYYGQYEIPDKRADGIHVIPYSHLSNKDFGDILEQIAPDLIVADEAHSFRHKDSARTRRFTRYMDAHPATRFIAMSGTLVNRSILDYAHLLRYALKDRAPLPQNYRELASWADAIDNEGKENATKPGALALFCENDEDPIREAYGRRLIETPGVIATSDSACSSALSLVTVNVRPSLQVASALAHVRELWEWDGVEYSYAMHTAQLVKSLTQGYFNRWVWPNGSIDHDWLEARNAWNRLARARLARTNTPGLDSYALLEAAAERGDWPSEEWEAWKAQSAKPEPQVEAIVFDLTLAQYIRQLKNTESLENAIVWVESPALGKALAEHLRWVYFGEGMDRELAECDPAQNRFIICSIKAHGTGKNLQHGWSNNIVLYPPANGSIWEQLIGRTHRPGQEADRVRVYVFRWHAESTKAWEQALSDAELAETTMRQPQKLLYADREEPISLR